MKRLFSLFFVFLLVFNFVLLPVSANEFEQNTFLDVLDYDFPGDSDSTFYDGVEAGEYIRFELPYTISCGYVDIVIANFGSAFPLDGVKIRVADSQRVFNADCISLGNSMYRITCNLQRYRSSYLDISFAYSSTTYKGQGNFLSVRISQSNYDSFYSVGGLWLSSVGGSIQYMSDSSTPLTINFPYSSQDNVAAEIFNGRIYLENWKNYDFLNVRFTVQAIELNSIAGVFNDSPFPIDVNFVEGPPSYNDGIVADEGGEFISPAVRRYYVDVFIDCRNLVRSNTYLYVDFSGSFVRDLSQCYVSLVNVTGYIETYTVDGELYFLRSIWDSIKSGFSSVGTSLKELKNQTITNRNQIISAIKGDASAGDSYNDKVQSQVGDLENASNELNKLEKPDITGDVFDLSGEVNNSDILLLTSGIRAGLDVPLIRIIFVFALTFCLASFVLYGKK